MNVSSLNTRVRTLNTTSSTASTMASASSSEAKGLKKIIEKNIKSTFNTFA